MTDEHTWPPYMTPPGGSTSTTTTRPTPEQINDLMPGNGATVVYGAGGSRIPFLDELRRHGYVIVHPDDVPDVSEQRDWPPTHHDAWIVGWNACRTHIFGD